MCFFKPHIIAGRQGSGWTWSGFISSPVFTECAYRLMSMTGTAYTNPHHHNNTTLFSSPNQFSVTGNSLKDYKRMKSLSSDEPISKDKIQILWFMHLMHWEPLIKQFYFGRVHKVDFLTFLINDIRSVTRKALFWETYLFRASASSVNGERFSHGWKNQMKAGFRLVSHISSSFINLRIGNVPILAVDLKPATRFTGW